MYVASLFFLVIYFCWVVLVAYTPHTVLIISNDFQQQIRTRKFFLSLTQQNFYIKYSPYFITKRQVTTFILKNESD